MLYIVHRISKKSKGENKVGGIRQQSFKLNQLIQENTH